VGTGPIVEQLVAETQAIVGAVAYLPQPLW
jgi:hypothetical protein